MSAIAKTPGSSSNTNKRGPVVSRPKGGQVVNLHHPLVTRIMQLRAAAKNIVNGPNAYRSADFTKWFKNTANMYGDLQQFGLPAVFEDRFLQRTFGRAQGVLTEAQIFAAFKADVNATVLDFQQILIAFAKKQRGPASVTNLPLGEAKPCPNLGLVWVNSIFLAFVLVTTAVFFLR